MDLWFSILKFTDDIDNFLTYLYGQVLYFTDDIFHSPHIAP